MCFLALLSRMRIYLRDALMFFKHVIGLVDFMFGELFIIIVQCIYGFVHLGGVLSVSVLYIPVLLDTFCFVV